ncbi:helix-turn-helix domain-containing protein [Aliivibrio sifiae]
MINWIHPPKNSDVAKLVDCYWFLERPEETDSNPFPKLNPEPAGHLILTAPDQAYQYDIESDRLKGKGCHWLYPYSKTLQMDHSYGFAIIGVKFHVGALYLLNQEPQQSVADTIVSADLNVLFGTEEINEIDLIELAKQDPQRLCTKLDEILLPWLSRSKEDKHYTLAKKALPLLVDTPIAQLGELLHCSQRTLERSFVRVTGFTLKQCQSMNRLEALITYLYQREETDIDWLTVAYEFGFSDQPHLIRYLKSTLGVTPGEYAKQRDLTIDIYGGIE